MVHERNDRSNETGSIALLDGPVRCTTRWI